MKRKVRGTSSSEVYHKVSVRHVMCFKIVHFSSRRHFYISDLVLLTNCRRFLPVLSLLLCLPSFLFQGATFESAPLPPCTITREILDPLASDCWEREKGAKGDLCKRPTKHFATEDLFLWLKASFYVLSQGHLFVRAVIPPKVMLISRTTNPSCWEEEELPPSLAMAAMCHLVHPALTNGAGLLCCCAPSSRRRARGKYCSRPFLLPT